MNKSPCVQDCPRRTATCKVDGSCPDFEVYEKVRMKSYAEKAKARDKAIATNPRLGAAHQRIIKKNDRYKVRKMRRERV